jgi:hypothetical protein
MGRGLSDLQRFLLRRASEQPYLSYAEVLADYFGWEPRVPLPRHAGVDPLIPPDDLQGPSTRYFDPDHIGRPRYQRTIAALSRACRRLEARGFVWGVGGRYGHWHGVEITEAGRARLAADVAIATTTAAARGDEAESPSPWQCRQCGARTDRRRYCAACRVRREKARQKQYGESQHQRLDALYALRAADR